MVGLKLIQLFKLLATVDVLHKTITYQGIPGKTHKATFLLNIFLIYEYCTVNIAFR